MPHQRTIWKFPLIMITGPQRIAMPAGATVRGCGIDPANGGIAIWAECFVPDHQPMDTAHAGGAMPKTAEAIRSLPREFHIFATGDAIRPADLCWHGIIFQGAFVWHLFERPL